MFKPKSVIDPVRSQTPKASADPRADHPIREFSNGGTTSNGVAYFIRKSRWPKAMALGLRVLAVVFLSTALVLPQVSLGASLETANTISLKQEIANSSSLVAGIFQGTLDFIGGFFKRKNESGTKIDGQAIREKNKGSIEPSSAAGSRVSINAQSIFGGEAEFSKLVVMRGLLRGTNIDLGSGTIIASNVLYGLLAGDGITLSGDKQKPTIESAFWTKRGDTIVTRDPKLSLEIGGSLLIGTTTSSQLIFNGPAAVSFSSFATTTLPADLFNAWSIVSATSSVPILNVSTVGGGTVSVGTASATASFTVAATTSKPVAFAVHGAATSSAPVFQIDNFGNVGIGTTSTSSVLAVSGSSTFSGPLTVESDVYLAALGGRVGIGTAKPSNLLTVNGSFGVSGDARFTVSPFILDLPECSNEQVLETDSTGKIVCGIDDKGKTGGRGTVRGSGDTNQIAFWDSNDVLNANINLFWDNANNRLGIGTSSPATTTSISGALYLTGGLGVGIATGTPGVVETTGVIVVGGTGTSTFANGVQITTGCFRLPNGSCAGVIGSGGGVNTGTTNRLAYYSDTAVVDSINFLAVDATNSRLGIATTTLDSALNIYGTSTVFTLQSAANATNAFRILNAATSTVLVFDTTNTRLGIGTSSPATTTSIAGALYLTGGLGVGIATGTPGVIETTGVINVRGAGTSTFTNGINLTSGCILMPDARCAGGANPGTTNRLAYYSDAAIIDSANYLTVDTTNSRLGIGTTTLDSALNVYGTSTVFTLQSAANATNAFRILNAATSTVLVFDTTNTRLGIGTSTPATTTSIAGALYLTGGIGAGIATGSPGVLETTGAGLIGGAFNVAGASTFTGALQTLGNTTLGDTSDDTLTVNASSTFANSVGFDGNISIGNASGDRVTYNAALINFTNSSTTTIPAALNAFSYATSSTAVPFLTLDTTNYRVGIGTTAPATTFAVAGHCVTGDTRLRRRRRRRKKYPGRHPEPSGEGSLGMLRSEMLRSTQYDESGNDEYIYDEVAIVDVKPGDEVLSLNEKTGRLEYQPIIALLDMGVQPIYELVTESGKKIRTTGNHPYLTKYGWIKVAELRGGTEIASPVAAVLERLGSGGVPEPAYQFVSPSLYIRNRVGSRIISFFENSFSLSAASRLFNALRMIFTLGGMMRITTIPVYRRGGNQKIFEKPRSWVRSILSFCFATVATSASGIPGVGLIASYPWFARNSTTSWRTFSSTRNFNIASGEKGNSFFSDLHGFGSEKKRGLNMLFGKLRIGLFDNLFWCLAGSKHFQDKIYHNPRPLETRLSVTDERIYRDVVSNFNVSFHIQSVYQKILGFVKKVLESTDDVQWEKIVSIKRVGWEQVWDISVKNTHNFVANGLLAHNTYLTGGLGVGVATTTAGVIETTGAGLIAGAFNVGGATQLNSTLGVTGASTLSSTLAVTGLSTLSGGILANNASSTITNLTLVLSTTTQATTTYLQVSTLASTSRLVVSTGLGVGAVTTTQGAVEVSGDIQVGDDVSIADVLTVLGNVALGDNSADTLTVTATTTLAGGGTTVSAGGLSVTGTGGLSVTNSYNFVGSGILGDTSGDTLTVNASSTFANSVGFDGNISIGNAAGDRVTYNAALINFTNSATTTIPAALNAFSYATSSTAVPFLTLDTTNYRVGIGTTAPATTFSVGGAGNIYALGGLGIGRATTTAGVIETSGVINIQGSGTSTFTNGIVLTGGCILTPAGVCAGGGLTSNAGTANRLAYYSGASTLDASDYLITDGTNSRLGISSTTPSARLSVTGAGTGTGFLIYTEDSGGTARFIVKDNNTTGFGTSTKLSTLTVSARNNASISGTASSSNTFDQVTCSGSSCAYLNEIGIGDQVRLGEGGEVRTVTAVNSNTILVVDRSFTLSTTSITMTSLPSIFRLDDASSTVRLIVNNAGALGLGTTSPATGLAVATSTYISTGGLGVGRATTTSGNFEITGSALFGDASGDIVNFNAGTLSFANSATSVIPSSVNAWSIATSTNVGQSPIFSIDGSNGRVGIGTSSPGSAFVVQPFENAVNAISFRNAAGIQFAAFDSTNSRVSMGHANSAVSGLDLRAPATSVVALQVTGSSASQSADIFQWKQAQGAITFGVITAAGYMGIGTTTPNASLTVNSTTTVASFQSSTNNTAAFRILNAATSTVLVFDTTNTRLGIGTATPATTTSIAGALYLTGGLGVGIATGSPGALETTGNTILGDASTDTLTVNASSTFVNNVGFDGNISIGNASGDRVTYNAALINFTNSATTTIPAALNAWSVATSSTAVPFLTLDTTNYRVGIGTTAPATTFSIAGHCVTGDTRLRRRRKRKKSQITNHKPQTNSNDINPNDQNTNAFGISDLGFGNCLEFGACNLGFDEKYVYDEVMIKDIQAGDEIASLDEKTGRIVWSKVNALMDMGIKTTYRLRTVDGREIRTTATHPYLVKDLGQRAAKHSSPISGAGWLTVERIKTGDFIAVPKPKLGVFIDDANMFYAQKKAGWRIDYGKVKNILGEYFEVKFMNYHLALPETRDSAYKKTQKYLEILRFTYGHILTLKTKALKYIFDKESKQIVKKGNVDSEIILDVMAHMEEMDVVAIMSGDSDFRALADILLKKGKKVFFIGFEENTAWEIHMLKHLYLNRIREAVELGNKKPPEQAGVPLLPSVYAPDAFLSSSTGDNPDMLWAQVQSIEKVGNEQVYDIEVEGTHNFIGNDIVAHNTYLTGGLGVGVATTTSGNLEITGSQQIGGDLSIGDDVTITGGLGIGIATTTNGNFEISGSALFGDASGDLAMFNASSLIYNNAGTTTIPSANTAAWAYATSTANIPFLRFDTSNYRVGIGTTAPATTFSVGGAGNIYALGGLGIGRATTTAGVIETSGVINIQGTGTSTFTNGIVLTGGCILTPAGVCAGGGLTSNTGTANRLAYYSAASTLDSANYLTTDVTNSRLGIGSTTPGVTLSVSGSGVVAGPLTMQSFNATSTTATSTIQGFLDVLGTGTNSTSTYSSNLWVKGALQIGTGSTFLGNNYLNFNQAATTTLASAVNAWNIGGSVLSLDTTNSRLGIGTSTPWGLLSVNPNGISGPAFAIGSSTKCVTGDTKLKRRRRRKKKDGSYEDIFEDVRIDEIKEGDEILTLDEKTGMFIVSKVKALMDMGIKPVYTMTTSTGKQIRTTGNHPYLVAPELPQQRVAVFIDGANFEKSKEYLGGRVQDHWDILRTFKELRQGADLFLDLRRMPFIMISRHAENGENKIGPERADQDRFSPALPILAQIHPYVKGGVWKKVSEIYEGQMIATMGANGKPMFERIVKIEKTVPEQVYDIEVEGTHNFIGNDIVAHNTYLTVTNGGNVGVGAHEKLSTLTVLARTNASISGTASSSNTFDQVTCTGSTCAYLNEIGLGDQVRLGEGGEVRTVTDIQSNTILVVDRSFTLSTTSITMTSLPSIFRLDDASSTVRLIVNNAGALGLGTTSPATGLAVATSTYISTGGLGVGRATTTSGNFEITGSALFGDASGDIVNFNAGTLSFANSATSVVPNNLVNVWSIATSTSITPVLSVSSANGGRVGIGTSSPKSLLTVEVSPRTSAYSASDTDTWGDLRLFNITNTQNAATGILFNVGTSITSSVDGAGMAVIKTNTGTDDNLDLAFIVDPSGNNNAERMRLTSAGRLGINDTTPDGRFEISKSSGLGFLVVSDNADADVMIVTSSGAVGIGTSTPGAFISIAASTTPAAGINYNSILLSGVNMIYASSSTSTIPSSALNAFSFATTTTGVPFLSFDTSNYRAGIGTTAPAVTFSVGGAGNIYALGGLGVGRATTTSGVIETSGVINIQGTGTSTFTNGIVLTGGCILTPAGVCAGGGLTSNTGTANRLAYYSAASTLDSANYLTTDTTNSRLGIGTTSPAQALSVAGNLWLDSNYIYIGSSTAVTASTSIVYFGRATSTIADNIAYSWTVATSSTFTSGTPILAISTNTLKASTTLQGSFTIDDGAVFYDSRSGTTSIDLLTVGPTSFDDDAGMISWIDMPVTTSTPKLSMSYSAMLDADPVLTIYGITNATGGIISSTTAVGIGTTTPAFLLSVASTSPYFALTDTDAGLNLKHWTISNLSGSLFFATSADQYVASGGYATSSVAALFINTNGLVGVGTNTPSSAFSVAGNTTLGNSSSNTLTVNASSTFANSVGFNGNIAIGDAQADRLTINAGVTNFTNSATSTIPALVNAWSVATSSTAVPFLTLDTTNYRVGIGTTAPATTFSVAGHCVVGNTRLRIRRRSRRRQGYGGRGKNYGGSTSLDDSAIENCGIENSLKIENCKLKIDEEYIYDEVMIKDIQPNDEVLSLNEKTGRLEYQPIIALLDMGVQPIYELMTESGKKIRTTGNHPYFTKYGWIKVAELREGVEIGVPTEEALAMFGNQHLVIPKAGEYQYHQKSGNDSFYYFWIHELYEKLLTSFAKNKPNHPQKGYYSGGYIKVEKGHDFVFTFSAFAAAVFAMVKKAAVAVNPIITISQRLSNGAVLGINAPTTSEPKSIFAPSKKKFSIMRGLISHLINSMYHDAGDDVKWEKIVSIKRVGWEQVWDISVKNTHNFVANGLLAHNTYLTGGLGVGVATTTSGNLEITGSALFGDASGDIVNFNAGTLSFANSATSVIPANVNAWSIATSTAVTPILSIDGVNRRVGIGTNAPNASLEIGGLLTSNTIRMIGGTIYFSNNDNVAIGGSTSEFLTFTTNGGERVRIDSVGNLGIGDTGPDALLEVSASGGTSNLFMLSSDDANDGDRLIVKNSGLVGIGTTTPDSKLSVHSTTTVALFQSTTNNTAAFRILNAATSTVLVFDTTNTRLGIGTSSPATTTSIAGALYLTGGLGVGIATGSPGAIETTGNTILGDASTDTLTVNASTTFANSVGFNGSLALGDAQADRLTVNLGVMNYTNSATSTIPASVNAWSIGTTTAAGNPPIFSIDGSNGRVGIASSTPRGVLGVNGDVFFKAAPGDTTLQLTLDGTTGATESTNIQYALNGVDQINLAMDQGGDFSISADSSSGRSMTIGPNFSELVITDKNARMAIGTSTVNTNTRLAVYGTSTVLSLQSSVNNVNAFRILNAATSTVLVFDTTNTRLGIGTATPATTTSIAGALYLTGGLGVGIATGSPGALETTGNTILGDASTDTLTVNASSTFVNSVGFNGNISIGDASGDRVTYNAALINFTNSATTTIPAALNAWSVATSSTAVPFLTLDTTNYRVGLGTTAPATTLSVGGAGHIYALGGLGVGRATTTGGVIETSGVINIQGSGTSTFTNGIVLTGGCILTPAGVCAGGGLTSNTGTANRLAYYSGASTLDSANYLTTDTTNSRLGISSTTPSARLSITGAGTGAGFLAYLEDSGGTSRFSIKDYGAVGIGTSTKLSTLTVSARTNASMSGTASSSNTFDQVTCSGASCSYLSEVAPGDQVRLGEGGEVRTVTAVNSNTILVVDRSFTLSTTSITMTSLPSIFRLDDASSTVRLLVNNYGALGIGTTSPATGLAVATSTYISTGGLGVGRSTTTSGNFEISGSALFGDASGDIVNFNAGTLSFANNATSVIPANVNAWSIGTSTAVGSAPIFSINGSKGAIGIGTANPGGNSATMGRMLHVIGNGNGATPISVDSGAVAVFQRNAATGNDAYVYITAGSTGDAELFFGDSSATSGGEITYNNSKELMTFGTSNNSGQVAISSIGNLGIGTSTPDYRLTVYGTTTVASFQSSTNNTSAFRILNAATSTVLVFDTTNTRLGIGTSSPATTTSIAGALYLTGGLGVGVATGSPGVLETTGAALIGGVLNVAGASTFTGALQTLGNTTLGDTSGDTLTVNASSTFASSVGFDGNIAIGNASGDRVTYNAALINFTNSATTTIPAALNAWSVATSSTAVPFLTLDTTNYRVGIGTTAPATTFSVGGAGHIYALGGLGVGRSTTTSGNFEISGSALFGDAAGDFVMFNAGRINYNNSSTSTIPNNADYAWTIATSSTGNALFNIDSRGGLATTTILGGFRVTIPSYGASTSPIEYDYSTNLTTIDSAQLGAQYFETDSEIVTWIDMPVSTNATGTIESYTAALDGTPILTIHSVAAGSGSIGTTTVGIGTTTPAWKLQVSNTATSTTKAFFALSDQLAGLDLKHWTMSSQGGNFYLATSSDIYATSSIPALFVNTNGNIGIATTTTMAKLTVQGNIALSGCAQAATSTDSALLNTCVDVAETYGVAEDTVPGEILMISENGALLKATEAKKIIGVVSSQPAIVLEGNNAFLGGSGFNSTNLYESGAKAPVALVGRVPVKVNLEGGEIKPGDRIALSSVPGIGAKATSSGVTVGTALEEFSGNENCGIENSLKIENCKLKIGKIIVFINLGYSKLDDEILRSAQNDASSSVTLSGSEGSPTNAWSIDQVSGKVNVSFYGDLNLNGNSIINVNKILGMDGKWQIDENGKLVAQEIETQKLKVEGGITTKDRTTGQYYCLFVENGEVRTEPGECSNQSPVTSSENQLPVTSLDNQLPITASSTPVATSTEPTIEVGLPADSTGSSQAGSPTSETSSDTASSTPFLPGASATEASSTPLITSN